MLLTRELLGGSPSVIELGIGDAVLQGFYSSLSMQFQLMATGGRMIEPPCSPISLPHVIPSAYETTVERSSDSLRRGFISMLMILNCALLLHNELRMPWTCGGVLELMSRDRIGGGGE